MKQRWWHTPASLLVGILYFLIVILASIYIIIQELTFKLLGRTEFNKGLGRELRRKPVKRKR